MGVLNINGNGYPVNLDSKALVFIIQIRSHISGAFSREFHYESAAGTCAIYYKECGVLALFVQILIEFILCHLPNV